METENADSKKYHWAMDQLRRLMWHKSTATTEKYLEHRRHRQHLDSALQGWASHLLEMIESAPARDDQADGVDAHG